MKTKRFLAALLALTMACSLAACGGGSKGGAASTPSGEQVTMPNGDVLDAEQTFTTFLLDEPATLHPSKSNDQYGDLVLINLMEPLLRLVDDAAGGSVVTGAGAEKWEHNEDSSVWTFYLRDNTWSDGVAVTAKDYVYGIQRVLDPQIGSQISFLLTGIKNASDVNSGKKPVSELGVKAIDDKTLEITLEGPTPYFETLAYSKAMFPLRQDVAEKQGETYGANGDGMVFNGPFVLTNWVHNSEIMLAKNDKYWDNANVRLQTINFKIMPDENARYNSFENGSLESVNVGQPEWLDRFKAKEAADYYSYVNPQIRYHFFNVKDPIFSNANMRKAFTLAINREEVVKSIYKGLMQESYSWVPQSVNMGALGEYRSKVDEPLKVLLQENPDAKALLLKGMEELGLGTDPSTLKIKMTMGATTQWIRNYSEFMQQIFKNTLGVQIEVEYNEWPTFQSKTKVGDYQMGYMTWSIDYNEPMSMLSAMTSDSTAIPTGWVNEQFDALIKQASVEVDDTKRMELYKQAEAILLHDDTVLCPVVNEKIHRFAYDYVKGLPSNYFTAMSGGLKNVYISGK